PAKPRQPFGYRPKLPPQSKAFAIPSARTPGNHPRRKPLSIIGRNTLPSPVDNFSEHPDQCAVVVPHRGVDSRDVMTLAAPVQGDFH
ncbi:MAG: hypothetical protein ACREUJ_04235, partial [Burkholderiales bacterium]